MADVEDQDHELAIVNLVEDPPVTCADTPRPRVAHQLGGLPRPGILREPVDNPLYPLPSRAI